MSATSKMTPKIFLTGATGYIGGTAHACIAKAHPDYEFTLLVRDEKRAQAIKERYPNTKFVLGTLDDAAVVEKAAAEADIVVHTADSADNVPGANAIAKGLAAGHTVDRPGYWIHTSGTGVLTWYDAQHGRFGEAPLPEQKYSDIDDIQRIVTLPDDAAHHNVEKIAQGAISDAVKVAILSPPTIYGAGLGVVNTRSLQAPEMTAGALDKGFAPIVSPGLTEWDNVHVEDLGDMFVKLVEATQDPSQRDNPEIFGINGYFFVENGSHKWSDVARWIADAASKEGYLPEPLTKFVSQKEVEQWEGVTPSSWGMNSKGVAQRGSRYLGWKPKRPSLKEEVAALVPREAKARGLVPQYRKD